ncbi:glycosyltransferase family 8 protein [Cohnella kolymensis]|uniref:glycosyltransferase family 8 protein n=1 Tax=Cohnella kolymensis TaxID=1590652 RepID=UPI000696E827|nr:glycosyltransferase [Cohnella kolymensis]
MNNVHVVTTTSNEFAQYTAVMLNSLLDNKSADSVIHVYITINDKFTDGMKVKLNESVSQYNVLPQFITIDESILDNFKVSHHFALQNYYRIFTPDVLSKKIDKAIFLDSDIILKEDITQLWNIDIDDYFFSRSRGFRGG